MEIKEIIKSLKDKIQEHEKAIVELKGELVVFEKYLPTRSNEKLGKIKGSGQPSFNFLINSFFDDGIPKKSRELLILYRKAINNPDYKADTFSPRLSQQKSIKKHEFDDQPQENRYFYGKVEWFDGNKFKQEYIDKVIGRPSQNDLFEA